MWNMFKVNNKDIFIVNFEHILHLVMVFLLLTLSRQMPAGYAYYLRFESKVSKPNFICKFIH